jgi:NAD(P)-dependent dehydrogenase (short-subunit alcohol dehydrogenase family)
VTGASQGIGAAIATLFLDRGYNVVGTSRLISTKDELRQSEHLALVDGDIGQSATAQNVVATALDRFGAIDALVNNAGIFFPKPFLDYTAEDFRALSSTNLDGFIYITQRVVATPLLESVPEEFLRTLSPLGTIAASKDIAEAVFFLTEASQITGEVLHVDGGMHLGKW